MTSRLFVLFVAVFVAFVAAGPAMGQTYEDDPYSVPFSGRGCEGTLYYLGSDDGRSTWEVIADSLEDPDQTYVVTWAYEVDFRMEWYSEAGVRTSAQPTARVNMQAYVGGDWGGRSDLAEGNYRQSPAYVEEAYPRTQRMRRIDGVYDAVLIVNSAPSIVSTPNGPVIRCRPDR